MEGFSHKAKAFFPGLLMGTCYRKTNVRACLHGGREGGREGAPADRGTRLIEPPRESQLFIPFFRKRVKAFTC